MHKVHAVTCMAWVPRGKAKAIPDKLEVNEEDLQKVIDETKDDLDNLGLDQKEDEYDQAELEARNEELNIQQDALATEEDEEMEDPATAELKLDSYDKEVDINDMRLGNLVVHASCKDDPYLEADDDSEEEDDHIKDIDNVILAGKIEDDAAIVEAHVYNAIDGYFIHHDFLISSPPLCMEWLNFDPRDEQLAPGNLLAIGDLSPAISVWDLNLLGSIEPAFTLGFKKKRKKEKSAGAGHTKRVLSLAWNTEMEHVLASGSADKTVILWDLEKAAPVTSLTDFKDKVQTLKWNRKEANLLLTGCCDNFVRLFDCRSTEVLKQWELNGEIESITWDATDNNIFMAATDKGYVYVIDARHPTPKYNFKAHQGSCSGIAMNPKCPGCLVTVGGEDTHIRVWDVKETEAEGIYTSKTLMGHILTVATSPDDPFVYSFGGDGTQPYKVWDIRNSRPVRQRFCPRLNLPIDDKNDPAYDVESESEDEEESDKEEESEIVKRLKAAINKPSTSEAGSSKNKNIGGRLKKN